MRVMRWVCAMCMRRTVRQACGGFPGRHNPAAYPSSSSAAAAPTSWPGPEGGYRAGDCPRAWITSSASDPVTSRYPAYSCRPWQAKTSRPRRAAISCRGACGGCRGSSARFPLSHSVPGLFNPSSAARCPSHCSLRHQLITSQGRAVAWAAAPRSSAADGNHVLAKLPPGSCSTRA